MYNIYYIAYIANECWLCSKCNTVFQVIIVLRILLSNPCLKKNVLIISVLFTNGNELFQLILHCNTSNNKNIVKLCLFLRQPLLILHNLRLLQLNQGNHLYAHHHICQ
jgi:hypothetical protein